MTNALELPQTPYVTSEDMPHRAKQLLELGHLTLGVDIAKHQFRHHYEVAAETRPDVAAAISTMEPLEPLPELKREMLEEHTNSAASSLYDSLNHAVSSLMYGETSELAMGQPSSAMEVGDFRRQAIIDNFPCLVQQALEQTGVTLSEDGSCPQDLAVALTMLEYSSGLTVAPEAETEGFMTDGGWIPIHMEDRYSDYYQLGQ